MIDSQLPSPLQQLDESRRVAKRNLRLLWAIALTSFAWAMFLTMVLLFVTIRTGQAMARIQNLESHAGAQDRAIFAIAAALNLKLAPTTLQPAPAPQILQQKGTNTMHTADTANSTNSTTHPLSSTVRALIASGTDDQRLTFTLTADFLNPIDTRNQTTRYACMVEDLDAAIAAAKYAGVTLQEIRFTDEKDTREVYEVLHQGSAELWRSGQ